jgi:P27 family predicted phage terminase small subunit
MPNPIKPPGKRINRITKTIGVISAAGKAPRMPSGLCSAAQDAWRDYWADEVSGVLRRSDTTLVIRWVRNVDRYNRLAAEADREPVMVEGSTGQTRVNPIYSLVLKIEASIARDEAQLGVGPANRLKLGAQFSEAARTLAQINMEAANDDTDDPRAAIIALAERRPTATVEPTTD